MTMENGIKKVDIEVGCGYNNDVIKFNNCVTFRTPYKR